MQHILIYILKNISDAEITGTFDGKFYSIAPGGTIELPADVAGWYMDKHPGLLEQLSERTGALAENQDRATLTNVTQVTITGRFDGEDFVFEPGVAVPMHETAASWFMNTPPYAGSFELGIRQPDEAASDVPPHEPATAEQVRADEAAPKPKKTTKKTKEAPKA